MNCMVLGNKQYNTISVFDEMYSLKRGAYPEVHHDIMTEMRNFMRFET